MKILTTRRLLRISTIILLLFVGGYFIILARRAAVLMYYPDPSGALAKAIFTGDFKTVKRLVSAGVS